MGVFQNTVQRMDITAKQNQGVIEVKDWYYGGGGVLVFTGFIFFMRSGHTIRLGWEGFLKFKQVQR